MHLYNIQCPLGGSGEDVSSPGLDVVSRYLVKLFMIFCTVDFVGRESNGMCSSYTKRFIPK